MNLSCVSSLLVLYTTLFAGGATNIMNHGNCLLGADDQVGNCQNETFLDNLSFLSESSYSADISAPAPKNKKRKEDLDMGVEQQIDYNRAKACLDRIEESRTYMNDRVMVEEKYEKVRDICKNNHESCTFWSVIGECENNPAYMKVQCAPACLSCEVSIIQSRWIFFL